MSDDDFIYDESGIVVGVACGVKPMSNVTGPAIIRLPVPPSTNHLFANSGRGRFATREYEAWRTRAGLQLNTQRPRRFDGQVEIIISIRDPKVRADIDNRVKACLDLLVTHQIIAADDNRYVRKVTAQWADVVGCVVEVLPIISRAA